MKIHELLDSPEKWCIGVAARDANGRQTSVEEGVSFCLLGAAVKCYKSEGLSDVIDKIGQHVGNQTIVSFNDTSSYDKVYNLVKELDV
jgi:hypothetical protein